MKNLKKYLILLIMFLASYSLYSQESKIEEASLISEIKKEANIMGEAFIKCDYKLFVKFTHPTIIKLMGGENQMISVLTNTINQTKSQGVSFLSISFDNPTKICKTKNELQCTLKQNLSAKTPKGIAVITSTLIAISSNNGKKWFFIDTSNKDLNEIKKIIPNLSSEIKI